MFVCARGRAHTHKKILGEKNAFLCIFGTGTFPRAWGRAKVVKVLPGGSKFILHRRTGMCGNICLEEESKLVAGVTSIRPCNVCHKKLLYLDT